MAEGREKTEKQEKKKSRSYQDSNQGYRNVKLTAKSSESDVLTSYTIRPLMEDSTRH